MCVTFEVYNVLHHNRAVKIYAWKTNSHSNDYVHLTIIYDKIPRVPTYIFHTTPHNSMNAKQLYFIFIIFTRVQTYYKKYFLMAIIYVYIFVQTYIQIYLRILTNIKSHPNPIIHLFTSSLL